MVASLLDEPFHDFKGCDKIYKLDDKGFDLDKAMTRLHNLAEAARLGPTTQSLVEEAERRGIPWIRRDEHSLVQLGTGRYQKVIRASITGATSHIAVETASDKDLTKKILSSAGIPVPRGEIVYSAQEAIAAADRIGFPVVIKPFNGNHGRGVTTDLRNAEEIGDAFSRAQAISRHVIVEQHYTGRDFRALVVKGDVVAVSERVPAHVIGDGVHTIEELIASVNLDPRRGDGHEKMMTRIKIDDALVATLAKAGYSLSTIPHKKLRILLSTTANLSTGGVALDRTDDIHPDNSLIARRAALSIGLDVAGIDFILPDVSRSWREMGGGIVEVNAAPGFRMHLHPAEGRARNVAKPVLDALFPSEAKTQIPIIAITGTNGKSTTVRMVAHILRSSGLNVGFTSTSGVYINEECIWKGDASGPKSARLLLSDTTIDAAVLETARGGILREGLGIQSCDVGAVLNVSADHLGLGGVETIEDLAAVKSVIAEAVHRRGVSVLNADDRYTLGMARHAGGSVCLFSKHSAQSGALREHLEKGGRAVTRERIGGTERIVLHRDGNRIPVMGLSEIPATLSGIAGFNVENALAATAIATGLNIEPSVIRRALASFSSSFEQNPGRMNIYDGHGFRVIMDYAHNPAALRAFFTMIKEMKTHYLRVIGNISTPGDRRDDDIREVGGIAGSELDLVVFRELPDNRGRPAGEVVRLLAEGARASGCPENRIVCVYPEEEAVEICLTNARPGDLVILTPTKVENTWAQMLKFKPSFVEQRRQDFVEEHMNA